MSLPGSGNDTDGTIASYAWTQTVGPAVTLSGANTATASFTAPSVSVATVLTFKLTVTDNQGATGFDTITVTVNPANQSPTANAGPDQTVTAGALVSLPGSGNDTDGTIASYAWTQTVGPAVTLSGANTATAGFTAPSVSVATVLTFKLTVTDNQGATGFDTITVTVNPANQSPTANAGPDQTIDVGRIGVAAGQRQRHRRHDRELRLDPDGRTHGHAEWRQHRHRGFHRALGQCRHGVDLQAHRHR